MKSKFLLLIIILLFAGCTNTTIPIDYTNRLNTEKVKNIETLSEFNISEEEQIISLGDEESEIILQENKKVFAKKFNLSQYTAAYSIDIKTYALNGFFAPKLIFLDKVFKPTKEITAKDLRFDRGSFKGTIFINDNVDKINYLVVTQDISEIDNVYKTNSVEIGVLTTQYFSYIYASEDIKKTLHNAMGGTIKLQLKAYQPKVLGTEEK